MFVHGLVFAFQSCYPWLASATTAAPRVKQLGLRLAFLKGGSSAVMHFGEA